MVFYLGAARRGGSADPAEPPCTVFYSKSLKTKVLEVGRDINTVIYDVFSFRLSNRLRFWRSEGVETS
jgi:hypothetical protein